MSDGSRIGFGPRLGAFFIDIVLALIIGFILGSVAGAAIGNLIGGSQDMAMLGALGGTIAGAMGGMILSIVIFMLMEAFLGQSPGKMILGIKIKSQDGSNAGTGALVLRAVLKNISSLMNVLAGITGILALLSIGQIAGLAIFVGCFFVIGAKKLSFHDMIAKTAVYKK